MSINKHYNLTWYDGSKHFQKVIRLLEKEAYLQFFNRVLHQQVMDAGQ